MTGTMTKLDSITVVQNMRAMSDILCQMITHCICQASCQSCYCTPVRNVTLLTSFLLIGMCSTRLLANCSFHLWHGSHLLGSTSHQLETLICFLDLLLCSLNVA